VAAGAGMKAGAGASNNGKRMIVGAIGYLVSMGLTSLSAGRLPVNNRTSTS
jgi:hypothetical protein